MNVNARTLESQAGTNDDGRSIPCAPLSTLSHDLAGDNSLGNSSLVLPASPKELSLPGCSAHRHTFDCTHIRRADVHSSDAIEGWEGREREEGKGRGRVLAHPRWYRPYI